MASRLPYGTRHVPTVEQVIREVLGSHQFSAGWRSNRSGELVRYAEFEGSIDELAEELAAAVKKQRYA